MDLVFERVSSVHLAVEIDDGLTVLHGILILLFKHSSDSFGRVCQGSFAFLVSLSLAEGILAPRLRGALQADASRQIEVFFFLFPSFGGVRLAGGSSIGSADLLSGIRTLLERASLWTDLGSLRYRDVEPPRS